MTDDQLTPRQLRAVEALLAFGEVTRAADAVGVNRATIRRWRQTPAFDAALRAAEAEALDGVGRRLTRLSAAALDVIDQVLADAGAPAALRIRAADLVLARLLQVRELVEIEDRLAALEAAVAAREGVA